MFSPVLHNKVPVAVVDNVEVPQLSTTVTTGVEGVGFTVMVNVCGVPVQPLATGVTVIVATCVVAPLLIAVNDAMLPLPPAARPMLVLSLVQLKVVPVSVPVNVDSCCWSIVTYHLVSRVIYCWSWIYCYCKAAGTCIV